MTTYVHCRHFSGYFCLFLLVASIILKSADKGLALFLAVKKIYMSMNVHQEGTKAANISVKISKT